MAISSDRSGRMEYDSLHELAAEVSAADISHYHGERNHQGLGNELVVPLPKHAPVDGPIQCKERLGGMLRYYFRKAA